MVSFVDKITSIIAQQQNTTLRFCTLDEQLIIRQLSQQQTEVILDGGYPNSERKRAYFYTKPQQNITCFRIVYPQKQLTLRHQNILGTLLSLSITMDSIGDILPKQGVFFVVSEIALEIKRSFTSINNVPVTLEEIENPSVQSEQEFAFLHCITDSLRLDLVVSKLARISRKEAANRIRSEWIKINHHIEIRTTKHLQENDVVSIRKTGRFVIDDATGKTRKNKYIVKYRKFI